MFCNGHSEAAARDSSRIGVTLGALSLGTCTRKAALAVATLVACHEERAAYVVDVVLPGFDATTKLEPGDRIVAIDGEPLHAPVVPALVTEVNARAGSPVTLVVERSGHDQTIVVRPQQDRTNDGKTSWVLGIRPRVTP